MKGAFLLFRILVSRTAATRHFLFFTSIPSSTFPLLLPSKNIIEVLQAFCELVRSKRCHALSSTRLLPFDHCSGRAPSLLLATPSNVARAYQRPKTVPTIRHTVCNTTAPIRRTFPKHVVVQSCRDIREQSSGRPGLLTHHGTSQPDPTPRHTGALAVFPKSHISIRKFISEPERSPSATSTSTSVQYVARYAKPQQR